MITLSTLKDFTLSIGSAAKDASVAESAGFFGAIGAFFASSTVLIIAFAIIAIAMMVLLEIEREGWATTVFSLGIALLIWTFKMSILTVIFISPLMTIAFIVFYVLAGVSWSFLKWNSFSKRIFEKAVEVKRQFLVEYKVINDDNREALNTRVKSLGLKGGSYIRNGDTWEEVCGKIAPAPIDKKSTIISWISYWPMSLLGTLLNNPFRKFFTWVYESVSGFYEQITKGHIREAMRD